MVRSALLLAATSLATLVATGCSSSGTGSPEPITSPETPTSSAQAVEIESPKNLKAVDDACSLLTPQQLNELGMKAKPEHDESPLGVPVCDWNGDKYQMSIIPDVKSGGIDTLYKSRPSVRKSTVSGYPAAWLNKQSLLCRVEVGVAPDAVLTISYTSHAGSAKAESGAIKPCKEGEKIAAMALKNVPDA